MPADPQIAADPAVQHCLETPTEVFARRQRRCWSLCQVDSDCCYLPQPPPPLLPPPSWPSSCAGTLGSNASQCLFVKCSIVCVSRRSPGNSNMSVLGGGGSAAPNVNFRFTDFSKCKKAGFIRVVVGNVSERCTTYVKQSRSFISPSFLLHSAGRWWARHGRTVQSCMSSIMLAASGSLSTTTSALYLHGAGSTTSEPSADKFGGGSGGMLRRDCACTRQRQQERHLWRDSTDRVKNGELVTSPCLSARRFTPMQARRRVDMHRSWSRPRVRMHRMMWAAGFWRSAADTAGVHLGWR